MTVVKNRVVNNNKGKQQGRSIFVWLIFVLILSFLSFSIYALFIRKPGQVHMKSKEKSFSETVDAYVTIFKKKENSSYMYGIGALLIGIILLLIFSSGGKTDGIGGRTKGGTSSVFGDDDDKNTTPFGIGSMFGGTRRKEDIDPLLAKDSKAMELINELRGLKDQVRELLIEKLSIEREIKEEMKRYEILESRSKDVKESGDLETLKREMVSIEKAQEKIRDLDKRKEDNMAGALELSIRIKSIEEQIQTRKNELEKEQSLRELAESFADENSDFSNEVVHYFFIGNHRDYIFREMIKTLDSGFKNVKQKRGEKHGTLKGEIRSLIEEMRGEITNRGNINISEYQRKLKSIKQQYKEIGGFVPELSNANDAIDKVIEHLESIWDLEHDITKKVTGKSLGRNQDNDQVLSLKKIGSMAEKLGEFFPGLWDMTKEKEMVTKEFKSFKDEFDESHKNIPEKYRPQASLNDMLSSRSRYHRHQYNEVLNKYKNVSKPGA